MPGCPGRALSVGMRCTLWGAEGLEERRLPALHPTDALREKKGEKKKSKKPWPSFCFIALGSSSKDVVWWSVRKTANEKKKKIPLI